MTLTVGDIPQLAMIEKLRDDNAGLRSLNAELLAALETIIKYAAHKGREFAGVRELARAALAKVKEGE